MIPTFKAVKMAKESHVESWLLGHYFKEKYGWCHFFTENIGESELFWLRREDEAIENIKEEIVNEIQY